jgi:hypothetical protein
MIAINCTHCQQRLEMDEAFAGGVCRCQHCGTIQTVPSHLKRSAAPAAAVKVPGSGSGSVGHSGSGLDELADVVASSGLARSSLEARKGRLAQRNGPRVAAGASAPVDYATPKRSAPPLVAALLGAGLVVLALLGVVVYFVASRGDDVPVIVTGPTAPPTVVSTTPEVREPTLTIAGPAFADVPLNTGSVVYLLDRSQANEEVLDHLKAAVYYSVKSLGPDRRFQILFWSHPNEDIVAYPPEGLARATEDEVQRAGQALDHVFSYGNTDLAPALERAVAARPDAIVIATAKGLYLEDDTLALVETALKGTAIKVHTFALGETESHVLKEIAARTGGSYRELSYGQLRNLEFILPER